MPFYPSKWLQAFTVDAIRGQISIGQASNPINKIFDVVYDNAQKDKDGRISGGLLDFLRKSNANVSNLGIRAGLSTFAINNLLNKFNQNLMSRMNNNFSVYYGSGVY